MVTKYEAAEKRTETKEKGRVDWFMENEEGLKEIRQKYTEILEIKEKMEKRRIAELPDDPDVYHKRARFIGKVYEMAAFLRYYSGVTVVLEMREGLIMFDFQDYPVSSAESMQELLINMSKFYSENV